MLPFWILLVGCGGWCFDAAWCLHWLIWVGLAFRLVVVYWLF